MSVNRYTPGSGDFSTLEGTCDLCEVFVTKTVKKEEWPQKTGPFLCDECEKSMGEDLDSYSVGNRQVPAAMERDDGEYTTHFAGFGWNKAFDNALDELKSFIKGDDNGQHESLGTSVQDRPVVDQANQSGEVSPNSDRRSETDKTCY